MLKRFLIVITTGILLGAYSYCLFAAAPQSSGDNFAIEQFAINEGTSWMFGNTFDMRVSSIGEPVINISLSSDPDPPFYALFQGFLYAVYFAPDIISYQYDIDEVFAEEYMGGPVITEATWQIDPDPFFYWTLKGGAMDVLGYSVAFDELPDELFRHRCRLPAAKAPVSVPPSSLPHAA